MAILKGDVKLVASAIMDDVPEGGGAPTATVIQDGESNNIFPDISELDRAGGRVNLRKVHVHVQTGDRDTLLGTNFIVAEPPNDPNVSITVFSTRETFDRRSDAQERMESYLVAGPEWNGYLLENHVIGQKTVQLFQRPGVSPPAIGRTLVLIADEGLPDEVTQYVRVIRTEVSNQLFTDTIGGSPVDYYADVVSCEISDALRFNFAGSPPSRLFTRDPAKTKVRDTTVADASTYYGTVPLSVAGDIGDQTVLVGSVYTQLVPSARTEVPTLDARPAANRGITLATTPRLIEIAAAPHTMAIRIGQENRGSSFVQLLRPFPAPNTLTVSFRALGQWYELRDDGAGNLTGSGSGTINYSTGSISLTLPAFPDVGSSIVFSWGEKSAYNNLSGSVTFRAPEFAWGLSQFPIKPGSVVVTWTSGGVTKTATDSGSGTFTGDATGVISYSVGKIMLQPSAMIDAGGEFSTDYIYTNTVTENIAGVTPDAGGFATITLKDEPAPNSLSLRWITVRNVSNSSGSSQLVTKSDTGAPAATVSVNQPVASEAKGLWQSHTELAPGGTVSFKYVGESTETGSFGWSNYPVAGGAAVSSGTFTVTAGVGTFSVPYPSAGNFRVEVTQSLLRSVSKNIYVHTGANAPSVPAVVPNPVIEVRDPATPAGGNTVPMVYQGGLWDTGDRLAQVWVEVNATSDPVLGPVYDPPLDTSQLWSPTDLTAGFKTMISVKGASVTYFRKSGT